jgi:hypothetical protein
MADLIGQLKFLGIPNLRSALTCMRYNDAPQEASVRQAMPFLRSVLMRHTNAQRLGGAHILGLPPITKRDVVVKFTDTERAAYDKLAAALGTQFRSVRHRLRNHKG